MLWKILLLALFTVEMFAYENEMTEEQKDKFKERLTKYCKDNGADDKADEVLTAIRNSGKCIASIVNINVIRKEINEAKTDGTMNKVMAKYCEQSSVLKSCVRAMTIKVAACMTERVRSHIEGYNSAINGFIDFACNEENGELNIATFAAEGGLDCVNDKKKAIKGCSDKMKNNVFWEHCSDFDAYSACQIKIAKSCSKPAPGMLIEQLLKTIRAKSPCDENYQQGKKGVRALAKAIHKSPAASSQKSDSTTTAPPQETTPPQETFPPPETTPPHKTTPPQETTQPQETIASKERTTDDDLTMLRKRLTTRSRPPDQDPMAKYSMSVKQRQKFRHLLKIYCLQNGGDVRDATELEVSLKNLFKCITEVMDQKKVKKQMEMAMPFGKKMMKKVFGKYCERVDHIKLCIFGMTKNAVNCMTERTRYLMDGYNGVVSAVLDYWCHNGADRLGIFFIDGGPLCLENTFDNLAECGLKFNKDVVFWENCDTFKQWKECLVEELEACSKKSISYLAKGMLMNIYNRSPCKGTRTE